MSNYIEYDDRIAFHPGYYIKEIIDESGLTQRDFAYRLDTTPKNLSLLIRGEQSLSIDIAMKLSRMMGTSVSYWLNLQNAYDALIAEFKSREELEQEKTQSLSRERNLNKKKLYSLFWIISISESIFAFLIFQGKKRNKLNR